MDAIGLIRYQTRQAWAWLNMTVEDRTDEMANRQPPGVANSIAATYAHTIITADEDFNMVYDGGRPLLRQDAERGAFSIGLCNLPALRTVRTFTPHDYPVSPQGLGLIQGSVGGEDELLMAQGCSLKHRYTRADRNVRGESG